MRRTSRLSLVVLLAGLMPLPAAVGGDEEPADLELADGRFRVTLEWAEEPAGERWIQDLSGEGGMFGATDGGEAARLEVAETLAGKVRTRYRVDERVAAFVVTHIPSGVTRRIEVSGGGVLELDPAAFAAEAAVKVTPALDTARAVSVFVGPDGGSVTATDGGGVAFTLILPKGALLTSQEIKLTPLLGLGGFPFTPGFVAAVAAEPDGLRLWKLGTLKIETPAALPLAGRVTFGFRPGNQELSLHLATTGSVLTLPVDHLGGLGVGRGTDAEIAAQWERVPSHPSDRFSQELAQALGDTSQTLTGEAIGCGTDMNKLILKYYNKDVKPKLKGATKTCASYRAFLRSSSAWETTADELSDLGCPTLTDAFKKVNDVHKKGLTKCFNESFDKCIKKNTDAAHELLGAYRILQASGWQGSVDSKKIGKCVRFDFNFSSSFDVSYPDSMKEHLAVESRSVPLRQSGTASFATATAVAKWVEAKCLNPPSNCDPVATCTSSPNKPAQLVAQIELHGSQLELEAQQGSDVYEEWFSFGTTAPTYRRKIVCDGTTREDFDGNVEWYAAYWTLHVDEVSSGGIGILWLIREFSGPNPGVFSKVYQRPGTVGDDQVQENTSLFLSHKPQP